MTEKAIARWLSRHTASLSGKTVAVSGATGGLGQALCRHLAGLDAGLWLLDRNPVKSAALEATLRAAFPTLSVRRTPLDLSDFSSVQAAEALLRETPPDYLIFNAGIYSVPRYTTPEGLDNVFEVNFAAPYWLVRSLLPALRQAHTHIVAVGSIAHTYSRSDPADPDFATRRRAALVYGNSKRYLMYALWRLFRTETEVTLSVVHPGITFTGITAHYPPLLFALIRRPMQVIFPPPRVASLALLQGLFDVPPTNVWIGPRLFRVWGYPHREALRTVSPAEAEQIFATAESVFERMEQAKSRGSVGISPRHILS